MKVNLDTVLEGFTQSLMTITLGHKDHHVRELQVGDVLLIDRLEQFPPEDGLDFVAGLFKGDAPPCVNAWRPVLKRLAEIREIVGHELRAREKDDEKRKQIDDKKLTSVDAMLLYNFKLPDAIKDFKDVEDESTRLGNQVNLITTSIQLAALEVMPGKQTPVAIEKISRQVESQLGSGDFAGSSSR